MLRAESKVRVVQAALGAGRGGAGVKREDARVQQVAVESQRLAVPTDGLKKRKTSTRSSYG